MPHLIRLVLSHTFLTTIPGMVTVLPSLQMLELNNTNIECSCDMVTLKSWNVSHIVMDGECYQSNQRIQQYLMTYIDTNIC
ncbi:hypothetical protein DPMN_152407 [Dreissena polymorpha]|uniref:Uncharacterized protein n=1 Tax=Dreissena polymorpha TaxID=45954 RepID=A0A9D4FGS8_DREPO|nr:hypothetical protein DPMN_152407 [Dreissena polymorpha]